MKTRDFLKMAGLSLLALSVVALPACDSEDDDAAEAGDGDGDGDGDTTMIRVVHLGVGVPAVDVFANEAEPAAVTNLDFRMATGYLELPAAEYSFQVSLAGGTPADAAITAGPLGLEANTMYSAVAIGTLDAGDLEILPLVDAPPADAANIAVQVVHAAPVAGEVDIWEISDLDNPTPLLENVNYKDAATLELPPAAYELGIDVDDDAVPDLTFSADLSVLPGGSQINVFANNGVDGLADFTLAGVLGDGSVLVIPPNP